MKKIISMITCLIILTCMLVVPEPIEVEAAEDKNYNYYFEYLCCSNKDSQYGDTYAYYNLEFSVDKKICGFKNLTNNGYRVELCLYAYDDSGVIDLHADLGFLKTYLNYSFIKDYIKEGKCKYKGNREFSFSSVSYEGVTGSIMSTKTLGTDFDENGFLSTNIPYFSSQEECMAYINGEIDEKSAINYESDLYDIVYDLEAPKNLKIKDVQNTGPEGYFNITWEQTDPDYVNWQTEIYNYIDFRYRNSVLIFSWADWKYVEDYYAGQSIVETYKLSYKHRHRDNLDDGDLHDRMSEDYPTDYGGIYKIGDEKLYIRNYYYDGTYKHYSNWIVLEFDSEEDAWMNPEMNSTVVEKEGSELDVDDNGVPIQPDSNVVQDSEYTGGVNENYERVDGTDLISWIKNGFGLGGDNGVLGMMGESFSFIPGEIWAVFAAGISLMVVVAVFKFIRG